MAKTQNRVVLVNTSDFPCPGSTHLHATKFLSSFEKFGYQSIEITKPSNVDDLNLHSGDILYFTDHGLGSGQLTDTQLQFFEKIRLSRAIPVFWFWHNQTSLLDKFFGHRWVLTGEHLRATNVLPSHLEYVSASSNRENFIPLKFAANVDEQDIGSFKRTPIYNATFVGHRYQINLNRKLRLTTPRIKVVYTPPFIAEAKRISLFTNTHAVLGWHSQGNVANGHVVERVFEGLAYGAVVITDNPYALEATDGNVLFADTYSAAKDHLSRIIYDEKFRTKLQLQGINWARENGTYTNVARSFLDAMEKL